MHNKKVYEKQAENIIKLIEKHPEDWFFKDQQKKIDNGEMPIGFAPKHGICFSCNKDITRASVSTSGLTEYSIGEGLITGCPHCNKSFCD